jgi:hypothetical protein
MKLLLEKFDLVLQKFNLPNYQRLYTPLPGEIIELKLRELNINGEDFKTFFKWKNGFDPDYDVNVRCQIFNSGAMLSLDTIIEKINIDRASICRWNNSFIPIIFDSSDEYILYSTEQGKNLAQLYLHSSSLMAAIDPVSCYDSIQSMIETTIEAYENGILQYDQGEDWLNMDVDRYYEIAKKNNPESKFWFLQ